MDSQNKMEQLTIPPNFSADEKFVIVVYCLLLSRCFCKTSFKSKIGRMETLLENKNSICFTFRHKYFELFSKSPMTKLPETRQETRKTTVGKNDFLLIVFLVILQVFCTDIDMKNHLKITRIVNYTIVIVK